MLLKSRLEHLESDELLAHHVLTIMDKEEGEQSEMEEKARQR